MGHSRVWLQLFRLLRFIRSTSITLRGDQSQLELSQVVPAAVTPKPVTWQIKSNLGRFSMRDSFVSMFARVELIAGNADPSDGLRRCDVSSARLIIFLLLLIFFSSRPCTLSRFWIRALDCSSIMQRVLGPEWTWFHVPHPVSHSTSRLGVCDSNVTREIHFFSSNDPDLHRKKLCHNNPLITWVLLRSMFFSFVSLLALAFLTTTYHE